MSETHKEKRARKRAEAALAAGLTPSPLDLPPAPTVEEQLRKHIEGMTKPDPAALPKKLAGRAHARAMHLLLAASRLTYKTYLVALLSEYRKHLGIALEHYGTGWDARAAAVEGWYLHQLGPAVANAFDLMWPVLLKALREQAKVQGLPPVLPDPAPWRQESVRLMDKSARELGMDMRRGETEDDIGVGRAGVIADDQVGKIAAEANRLAQVAAGVDSFVWSGVMDDREREEHVALEGEVFRWDTDHYLPGDEVNCRCVALPVR